MILMPALLIAQLAATMSVVLCWQYGLHPVTWVFSYSLVGTITMVLVALILSDWDKWAAALSERAVAITGHAQSSTAAQANYKSMR